MARGDGDGNAQRFCPGLSQMYLMNVHFPIARTSDYT